MLSHIEKQSWPAIELVEGLLKGKGVLTKHNISEGEFAISLQLWGNLLKMKPGQKRIETLT